MKEVISRLQVPVQSSLPRLRYPMALLGIRSRVGVQGDMSLGQQVSSRCCTLQRCLVHIS